MATVLSDNSVQFGYLSYDDILTAVASGALNPYSFAVAKDTHQMFLVKEDLTLLPIKSKIGVFNTVAEAETAINADDSTYLGEVVSVLKGSTYTGYVVNYDSESSQYYIKEINQETVVDYDTALNIPIINLTGASTDPIKISELATGHYKVTGYFITPDNITVNSGCGNYVIVEGSFIKRISNTNIYDYTLGETVTTVTYVTDKFLADNNYMTQSAFETAIAAMNLVTKQELEDYVKNYVVNIVNQAVETKFQNSACTEQDINDLFS